MAKDVKRLFTQFVPRHYILELAIDYESMRFSGAVVISGQKVSRPTQRLTFHQSGLKVTSARLTRHDRKGDEDIPISRINNQDSFDEVRLHANKTLYPGRYTVQMKFTGKITRPMNGMYPCFFTDKGKDKKLIATQFESHHAREVLPCIDEPEAKATFDLSLTTPAGETVIANTPIKSQTTRGKLQETTFETTPKMSTYLLAFVFGDMEYKEAKTKDGVTVRAYATPDNAKFTDFALETAVKCLEFYNDYFGIPYPLAKCDLVALPDFASGAMENWGCITFREQTLLVDPDNSTLVNKQYVAMVVAHELAHQWFGNLVTMRWWTDLWLNEGFASWIEYLAVDRLFPEWQMWTQFAVDEQQPAFRLDALENTHPIEVPVHHPDEIRSIFDAISYNKGASAIHMLHDYLGPEVFQGGLRHYLNRHAYGNTDTVDLWQALEEISDKPVKSFMRAWTGLPGFPVVRVQSEDDDTVLTQKRFFLNPKQIDTKEQVWPIPLLTGSNNLPDQMSKSELRFKLKDGHDFKLNQGQSGFYRTAYAASHLKRLGEHIRQNKLGPLDRLGILSDLLETAKAGQSDTADALTFLNNFETEQDYAVWDIIAATIGSIRLVMDDDEVREAMKPYVRQLASKELSRLGWDRKDTDTHFDRLLRPIILGLAANADESHVVKHCRKLFDNIEKSPIDPDLRGVVFSTIARVGDKSDFDKLLKLHDKSSLSEERNILAAGLTGFRQEELIKRALALITTDRVRLQDVSYWIAYSFINRYARGLAWDWLKTEWEWLEQHLGTDLSFYRMPIYVARVQNDQTFVAEYKSFFEPRLNPAMERSYKQGMEMLQWQSAWRERDLKEVKAFFKSKK